MCQVGSLPLTPQAISMDQIGGEENTPDPDELEKLSLTKCARVGDQDGLGKLLREERYKRRVNRRDEHGMTALHYAARYNQLGVARILVEDAQAEITVKDNEESTPLHYAARKKQTGLQTEQMVEYLLTKPQVDVNAKDKYLSTPLHFAAMRGNQDAAKALLSSPKLNREPTDHMGATPLHEAVVYNHVTLVELLLGHDCDVMAADNQGSTALHLAAMNGDIDIMKMLINHARKEKKDGFIGNPDNEGNTALHLAIENKLVDAVQLLLDNGADINRLCRPRLNRYTSLHLAAIAGDEAITAILLAKGASATIQDDQKCLPLHRAAENKSCKVAELLLIERSADDQISHLDEDLYSPLLTACCYDNAEMAELLLKHGSDVEVVEQKEMTCLHLATQNDQKKVIQVLLKYVKEKKHTVLLDAEDQYGNTALHIAAGDGKTEIVDMLLSEKAKYDLKNEDEETPFLMAATAGHVGVCELLVKRTRGKCVYDEEEDSNTALHLAAQNGHRDVVQHLIAHGADKQCRNCRSKTPLDYAAEEGHLAVVNCLLEEDVPVDPLDKTNRTPLHLAARNGHVDVVKALLHKGADVSIRDSRGDNALDLAIKKKHEEVAAVILGSDTWRIALMNDTRLDKASPRNTPLRQMIRKMPRAARMALDRCVTTGPANAFPEDPEFYVEFNYEYLDDTFSKWENSEDIASQDSIFNDDDTPVKEAEHYSKSPILIKDNHPLQIMADFRREVVLTHPLTLALIRRKWGNASIFFLSFLATYACFLGLLSAYVIVATPPYTIDMSMCEAGLLINQQTPYERVSRYFIWILAVLCLTVEGFQLFATRSKYLTEWVNLLDWFSYVSAIVITLDLTECGVRTEWQWQLAVFGVFIAWIDLLLLTRRLPQLGMYVVMIVEIFYTFMKFVIVFLLFLLAFAICFFMLLQNQDAFRKPWYSLMKTWVMMIGEMDFTDIFHGDQDDGAGVEDQVFYEETTYAIFVAFLILMAIILMNLLTGLAVDDVNVLREHAKLQGITMQIDLCLDVEMTAPRWLQNRWKCIVKKERVYPNKQHSRFGRLWLKLREFGEGDLAMTNFIHQAIDQGDGVGTDDKRHQIMNELEQRLTREIDKSRVQMMSVQKQLTEIKKALTILVKRRN